MPLLNIESIKLYRKENERKKKEIAEEEAKEG